jgi:hypothetical protein
MRTDSRPHQRRLWAFVVLWIALWERTVDKRRRT